jgi:hypothetical protein
MKKEKEQKDKQRFTKHYVKTKDQTTQIPLKTGVNSGSPEGYAIPSPPKTPIVFLLLQTQ